MHSTLKPSALCPYRSLTDPVSVHHASTQRVVKGEDVVFDCEADGYRLFAVCDGHHGSKCAAFVEHNLWTALKEHLPLIPTSGKDDDTFHILTDIRKALVTAFTKVDDSWYRENKHSGTTLTVALVIGRLLTVANVGDSLSYLYDGRNFLEVSKNHRLDTSPCEKKRLNEAGMVLAPLCASLQGPARIGETGYGPLRVWPGGLAVSRSVGDADVTPHVLCIPHIHQLLIPETGARLILGSDGLWDVLKPKQIKRTMKRQTRDKCPEKLADMVSRVQSGELQDDVSLTIVDIVPKDAAYQDFKRLLDDRRRDQQKSTFQAIAKALKIKQKNDVVTEDYDHFLADVDGVTLVPERLQQRQLHPDSPSYKDISPEEFTVNGAQRLQGVLYNP